MYLASGERGEQVDPAICGKGRVRIDHSVIYRQHVFYTAEGGIPLVEFSDQRLRIGRFFDVQACASSSICQLSKESDFDHL